MITRLPFVFGAATMAAVMAAVVIGMARPSRPPLIPAQKTSAAPITDRWPVKEVRTIPITPKPKATTPQPEEAAKPRHAGPPKVGPKARPPLASNRLPRSDICRGKGKRYTNNKRSWRCKR